MVQGVDGGPPAGTVAAFPGVQALVQSAVAGGLDFGGHPGQAQKRPGPGDGPGPKPGGGGQTTITPGVPQQGATVPPRTEVRRRGVRSGHREDSTQGDPSPTHRHQAGTQQQVMAAIHPLHVLKPPLPRPPTRHRGIHTHRHRPAQRWPGHQRVPGIPPLRRTRPSNGATTWALPLLSDTRG